MKKTMYELKGLKAKNSILKSVVVTDERDCFENRIIEVEPYDDTFLNAIKTPSKYDDTVDRILKSVYKMFPGETSNVAFYTDYGHIEIYVNDFWMTQYGLN